MLGVAGCAPMSVSDFAARHRMTMREVEGSGFNHLVIQRMGSPPGTRLHVYIEGDGIPWRGNLPSADPTPRNTLALRLANLDSADVAYIGRPCYFGIDAHRNCFPKYWTSDRYGEEVLQSMASVIRRVRQPQHIEIVLIGHSGGGTLAALLESRVDGVVGIISIAANLDTDEWTRHHGYDGLTGSLNPAAQERVTDSLHLQLVGGKDRTVPAYTSENYAALHANVDRVVFEDFDHVCCWEEEWPAILADFSSRIAHTPGSRFSGVHRVSESDESEPIHDDGLTPAAVQVKVPL